MTADRRLEIPDDLWRAAELEAEQRGEDVDTAVQRLLRAYVERRDGASGSS